MVESSWLTVAGEPLKQRVLRSFHISHAISANSVSAPLRFSPCHLCLQRFHQSSRLSAPIYDTSAPSIVKMFHQICLESEQEAMIWSMVFWLLVT